MEKSGPTSTKLFFGQKGGKKEALEMSNLIIEFCAGLGGGLRGLSSKSLQKGPFLQQGRMCLSVIHIVRRILIVIRTTTPLQS